MSHTFVKEKVAFIKFKGVADMYGLFDMIFGWMMKNKFDNFNEDVYKTKLPEIERKWTSFQKRTEYIQETVIFECHFWGIKPVEVVKDGKKQKLYQFRGQISLTYVIDTDWDGNWEKSEFWEKLRNFYDNYIIKNKLLFLYVGPLEDKVLDLAKDIKAFLGMEGE